MRSMKNSGIEWIGNIPQKWILKKIKNATEYISSGTTPASNNFDYYGGNVYWIQSGDIYGKSVIVDTAVKVTELALKIPSLTFYVAPYIVMAMYGGSIGNTAISLIDACTNQACCCVKNDKKNDLHFMHYWLDMCKNVFLFQAEGGGQPNISQVKIKNQYYVQPPLSEQEKITAYLDRKCSEIDALTADIQKQIETLEEYKRSLITESVTKGLDPNVEMKDSRIEWIGKIPSHWAVHPMYYYFNQRIHKNYLGTETNLLSLSYGKIVRKDINSLDGLLPESYNTYNIIEEDDIVFRLTDLQNDKRSLRTGIAKEHGIITSAYITVYPIKPFNASYFHYLLHSYDIKKVFYNMGNGVRQGLNFDELSKLMLIEPTIEEQNAIAAYLDQKCSEIDSIISQKKQQLSVLDEYKKSLIYEYVTGKKEVVTETTVTAVDPLLLLIAKILDNIQMHKGKIRVIKLALLSEYLYIPKLKTQYYRYPQGAYDIDIDKRLNEINKLGWFDISVDDSPMTWKKGKKYNEFKKQSQNFNQYDDKIIALIRSIGNYRESHIGRISTLFAVWNDFIIDGVPNPSDKQIIQEVVNNWTPNKAKTAESNWRKTLEEMKSKGIIPQGKGLHTKKKGEK